MNSTAFRELMRLLDHPEELESADLREETYDLARISDLDGNERTAYVAALVDHAEHGDGRAIMTIAEMGATEAVPRLERLAKQATPNGAIARRALMRLGAGTNVAAAVGADASQGGFAQRFGAVMDLARVGGADALAAVERALADPDSVVRSRAFQSLLSLLGIERFAQDSAGEVELRSPLRRLALLLSSDLPPLQKLGADALRAIASQLVAGKRPAEVGIEYHSETPADFAERFGGAVYDADRPLVLDEVRPLVGHDRAWAETILAVGLERKDPRIPTALADLGAAWTLPAMRAAVVGLAPDDAFRRAVAEAESRLTRS